MLEMAESQHTNAQETLSFQAYSRRVGTSADSAKPSQYSLVSDWDDCVPEWHKSLTAPHFKDRRDCSPLCNRSLIVHETFAGTENQKYYHTTAAFPYLLRNPCFPISTTRLHGPGLLEGDPKWSACTLTHPSPRHCRQETLVPFGLTLPQCLTDLQPASQPPCSAHGFPWGHSKCNFRAENESICILRLQAIKFTFHFHNCNYKITGHCSVKS